jgi:hypothetical protein
VSFLYSGFLPAQHATPAQDLINKDFLKTNLSLILPIWAG